MTMRVTNRLAVDTSIHWHGIILPTGMEGVPGLSFAGIKPGETFEYRFDVQQSGTYWYHSHSGFQEQTGLYGAIIIETELLLFVGDQGRAGISLELEKELVLTQRWQLLPSLELVAHGHNNSETGAGSGLSTVELGLRLSYRVQREFMPYIGVQWEKA